MVCPLKMVIFQTVICCLVVDLPLWKNDFVSWDDDIPNIWKNKTCSKPPTSLPFELLPPILLSINMWHAPLGFQEILKDAVLISPLLLTNQSVYSILELVNWLDPQLYMEYPHWYTGWNMGYICYIVWNMWGLMWIRSYGSQVGPHPSTQSGWRYTYKVVPP